MVGKFGLSLSNKGSPSRQVRADTSTPPPPYRQNGYEDGHENPILATATTTTTTHVVTTTTHTTTHFFSLPLWRRRGTAAFPTATATPVPSRLSSDEFGVTRPPTKLGPPVRDKDLPPTPSPAEDNMGQSSHVVTGSFRERYHAGISAPVDADIRGVSPSSTFAPLLPGSSTTGESSSQPAVALARAALGIGLPHVMPASISASSSATDLHAHSLKPPPIPTETSLPKPSMRRVKSFQKEPDVAVEESSSPVDVRERRRARGLSLGPFHFASNVKGKEKQLDPEASDENSPSVPRPLSRKSSFWSRRRVDSQATPPVPPLNAEPSLRPFIPALQPVSPFYADTIISSPRPRRNSSSQTVDLRRRHSERSPPPSSPKFESIEDMCPPRLSVPGPSSPTSSRLRRPKRPKTADAASSPHNLYFPVDVPRVITSSPPTEQPQLQPDTPVIPDPPSPLFQISPATRPRAQTNPPLLHRLSINLFGSSPTSSTPYIAPNPLYDSVVGPDILVASPSSSYESSRLSLTKRSVEIPRPRADEEPPEVYLQRLTEAVSKAEVATVLASNSDPFHARALRAYIDRFDFTGDPLDVALRRLLMDVGLPRETQQIDRVMEAFAARYMQCHPDLFISDDHPYILAFSLIMLHTDAFNKSNKRKMTKPDYVKNTRLPGVPPEVLDCFYDNIVFVPFIFIEDPVDINGQRGIVPEAINTRRMSTINVPTTPGGASTLLGKSNKIDPYFLITRNLLDDLRVNVVSFVPLQNPYVYQGTAGPWDEEELLRVFTMAGTVDIVIENRYTGSPWFALSANGGSGPTLPNARGALPPLLTSYNESCSIKVTKVGVLLRKDDSVEGGRRGTNRKWREWCVLLTGSQLLFFRDLSCATSIQAQINPSNEHLVQKQNLPQPDEYASVKDAIAVFDKSYTKHPYTLRLVMPDGRHYLFQASDGKEMNEWISRINYSSAFKTAGVRMRPLGMSRRDIELTGIAAAASHLREMHHRATPHAPPRVRTWYAGGLNNVESPSNDPSSSLGGVSTLPASAPARQTSGSSTISSSQYESSSRLFKATFDEVKTELASGRSSLQERRERVRGRQRTYSLEDAPQSSVMSPSSPTSPKSELHQHSRRPSRSDIIRSKIHDLEERISLIRTQLDTDMRFVRNLAVLTPFQRSTRDRVQLAVQGAAKRIMQMRLEMEKLVCYRDVLSDDLLAEERDWAQTKRIAMRAATDQLALSRQHTQTRPEPQTTWRLDGLEVPLSTSPKSIPRTTSMSMSTVGHDSSLGDESFHSAVSSVEWHDLSPGSAAFLDSRGLDEAHAFESPRTSPVIELSSAPKGEFPFPDVAGRGQARPLVAQASTDSTRSSANHDDEGGHEKFFTAAETTEEQAEEWDKTRAAKRVSLVRLPPDLRIAVLFGKHGRSESISEGTATAPSSPDRSGGSDPYNHSRAITETFAMLDV
ncbi:uncharacterized protein FIBRA_02981 [Fibroporia radiculosa]|uniref:SEC7 domain-containing protein n=1 Tax=Fibroporia radiculosa TaxID=599839 RepID=J4H255_9APHY|nr:uncharacterized protein FIBRA_02981 [Fibroporia radiculosa]CCM00934.1 predicted protein [Fibroporia radiculosa]